MLECQCAIENGKIVKCRLCANAPGMYRLLHFLIRAFGNRQVLFGMLDQVRKIDGEKAMRELMAECQIPDDPTGDFLRRS